MTTFRPYQHEAVEAVLGDLMEIDRALIVLATGGGKTVIAGELARRFIPIGPVLFLADAKELVEQAADKLARVCGHPAAVVMGAASDAHPGDRLVVGTTQSFARRLDRWPANAFSLIIVDECFPAGTMISGKPIEQYKVGDAVESFNERTGKIEVSTVTDVMQSVANELVTVSAGGVLLRCTKGHPFFTKRGWIPACQLTATDYVLRHAKSQNHFRGLPQLPDLFSHDHKPEGTAPPESAGKMELLKTLPKQHHVEASEGQKSYVQRGVSIENEGRAFRQTMANEEGWKRMRASAGANLDSEAFRLENGTCRENKDAKEQRISSVLQGGYRQCFPKDCDRNRRSFSQHAIGEREGQEEGQFLEWVRVEGVESEEVGGSQRPGQGDEGCAIFNLTVEPNNTYIANGIVVHNCHRNSLGAQAQAVLAHFSTAQVVGMTATPFRSDAKQLGHYYQKISCDIGLKRLVAEGWLCRIKVRSVACPVDLSAVKRSKIGGEKDLKAEDVAKAMEPHIEALAKMLAENYEGRKTVGFVPLISTSKDLAAACRGLGLRAVHVDGTDRTAMECFAAGRADIILNSSLLTTGWDFPALSCVALMRPTESFSLFSQMVGRGTRLCDGKDHLLVLDPLWQADEISLIRPSRLVSPDAEVAAKVDAKAEEFDLFEAEEEAEKQAEADKLARLKEKLEANAKRKSREVDPVEFALDLDRPDIAEYEPVTEWEAQPATPKQVEVLVKNGFPAEGWCIGKATKMLDVLFTRRSQGMASPKQVKWLKKFGVERPLQRGFEEASLILDARFSKPKTA